ncbi:MAG TPA: STAS domain-containing protein [Streptosporangiaceae bacterium]
MPVAGVGDDGAKPAEAAGLDMSYRADQGYFIVTLCGALNAAIAPVLREYLLKLTHESAGRLIIDVSAVTDADSHGLSVLVGTRHRANLLGGPLRLAGPAAEVAGMLTRTGLDRQLRIYDSVEAAISSAASP